MIVKGECIRCGRKVRSLQQARDALHAAMFTATRAAEQEIIRDVHADLGCHLEKCERPVRALPSVIPPEVDAS